jgi:hypothetical protein
MLSLTFNWLIAVLPFKVDMVALRHMTDSDLKALGIPMVGGLHSRSQIFIHFPITILINLLNLLACHALIGIITAIFHP